MDTFKKLTSDEKGKLTGGFSVQSKDIDVCDSGVTVNINCGSESQGSDILNYNCFCTSCDAGTVA